MVLKTFPDICVIIYHCFAGSVCSVTPALAGNLHHGLYTLITLEMKKSVLPANHNSCPWLNTTSIRFIFLIMVNGVARAHLGIVLNFHQLYSKRPS